MRVGIDVGGTNTDAVLMDGRRMLAAAKAPTTADVTGGISSALRDLVTAVSLRDVRAVGGQTYLCHGGHEFDGRELSALDAGELRRVAADIAAKGLRSIALCSVFSPVNAECEQ